MPITCLCGVEFDGAEALDAHFRRVDHSELFRTPNRAQLRAEIDRLVDQLLALGPSDDDIGENLSRWGYPLFRGGDSSW